MARKVGKSPGEAKGGKGSARGARAGAIEAQLDAIRLIRDDPRAPAALDTLRAALSQGHGLVVAAAAALVESHEIEALAGLLGPALRRLLAADYTDDPGCKGKDAVVGAMLGIGIYAPEELLAGARHRQREPAWSEPPYVDTAAALRGNCAVGLAQAQHRSAGGLCAELLADLEWQTRAGAARALGLLPAETCVPLLRFKVLTGDEEPQVTGDCLRSLLAADAGELDFVAARLDDREEIAEQAALALGESRVRGAAAKLTGWFERTGSRGLRRVALLALIFTRDDAAVDFVLARLVDSDRPTAAHALDALAVLRDDPRIAERVLDAARRRRDPELTRKAAEVFGRR